MGFLVHMLKYMVGLLGMHLPSLFRISFYLCLSVSTLTLSYASQVQLPSLDIYYFIAGLLILLAWLTEERWRMSNLLSNVFGLILIGAGAAIYLGQRAALVGEEVAELVPQLLPWGGVILNVLLLFKLFRPKNISDYWMINAISLVQVILSCFLAMGNKLDRDAPYFPALLIFYLLCLAWALRNLTLYHDAVLIRRRAGMTITELHQRAPRATLGAGTALAWFGLILLFGLVIFFSVPRGQSVLSGLLTAPGQAQTGYNSSVDLNAQGTIEVSEELVFDVQAVNQLGQAIPIPEGQRWRGDTCTMYDNGRWRRVPNTDMAAFGRRNPRAERLPDTWFRLTYRLDVSRVPESDNPNASARYPSEVPLFCLEPFPFREDCILVIDNFAPRLMLGDDEQEPMEISFNRTLLEGLIHVTQLKRRHKKLMYSQDVRDRNVADDWWQLMPWRLHTFPDRENNMVRGYKDSGYYARMLALPENVKKNKDGQPGGIPTTTAAILSNLVQQNKLQQVHVQRLAAYKQREEARRAMADEMFRLPLQERLAANQRLRAQYPQLNAQQAKELGESREAVAVALEQYLATSGDYAYNMDRVRNNLGIDPTEDFLCHVKLGHCSRFASALALMLRTLGIPSRIVVGFRGSDWNATSETHEIRGKHAHIWVEALVDETEKTDVLPGGDEAMLTRARLRWRTLDPTPYIESGNRRNFLANNLSFASALWEFFILDFTGPEQRQRFRKLFKDLGGDMLVAWWKELSWWDVGVLVMLLGCLLLTLRVFGRRLWRKLRTLMRGGEAAEPIFVPFFARFLRILQRQKMRRAPSQTPAEFITGLTSRLQQTPATALVAHVPPEVVDSYYAVRFGQVPLDDALTAKMTQKLDALEEALGKT
jgi:transglutaminase-like putative cysteine protease